MRISPNAIPNLNYLSIQKNSQVHYQKEVAELVEAAIAKQEGQLTNTGALAADTGYFTGRTPDDRFIVRDARTAEAVWWGSVNQPVSAEAFDALLEQIGMYLNDREIYVRDGFVGSDPDHHISVRTITETAYQNLFASNLFIRPDSVDPEVRPDWSVLATPGFVCAVPERYGLHHENFVIINFTKRIILIAGTGYTGEIKKSMFSVLNFVLPFERKILTMHCAANTDELGNTALFFGLSGTGKTTLSADSKRLLVGDDEHGWTESGVFNFEGGCYAKCIGLDPTKEPEIYDAVRFGALLENVEFFPDTRIPDYDSTAKTENTRAAYPLRHITTSVPDGMAPPPKNIFFLTADAFGVVPPISLLSTTQAMYHFLSGYTAKVAGTEIGINAPKAVFSACFGEAFLPLHPTYYAELLRERLADPNIRVWLVNTGWIAGPYGVGRRIKLEYTRAMIRAALTGKLEACTFITHPVFKLRYPTACPAVPPQILNPITTWTDPVAYYEQANRLAQLFIDNFQRFASDVRVDVLRESPTIIPVPPEA